MISVTSADKVLKDYYLSATTKEIEAKCGPFFSAIEKTTAYANGKDAVVTVVRRGENGVRAVGETDDLPSAHANKYVQFTAPLKNIYGTIEISDKVLRASSTDTGSIVNLLNVEMQGLVSSAKESFCRMLFGDERGYVMTVDNGTTNAPRKFYKGVTLYTEGGEAVTIESIDVDTGEIALSNEYEGNLYMCKEGEYELSGLHKLFATDENIYGVERDDYSTPIIKNSEFGEDALVEIIDEIEENYDEKPNMIIMSYKNRKALAQEIAQSRRFVNSTELGLGYGDITVGGVKVYADKYCPDDAVFLLNTDDFVLAELCDWEWLENENGSILTQASGKASYTATLVKYAELICKRPCAQAMIKL